MIPRDFSQRDFSAADFAVPILEAVLDTTEDADAVALLAETGAAHLGAVLDTTEDADTVALVAETGAAHLEAVLDTTEDADAVALLAETGAAHLEAVLDTTEDADEALFVIVGVKAPKVSSAAGVRSSGGVVILPKPRPSKLKASLSIYEAPPDQMTARVETLVRGRAVRASLFERADDVSANAEVVAFTKVLVRISEAPDIVRAEADGFDWIAHDNEFLLKAA